MGRDRALLQKEQRRRAKQRAEAEGPEGALDDGSGTGKHFATAVDKESRRPLRFDGDDALMGT